MDPTATGTSAIVDYRDTSRRPAWTALPPSVRAEVARVAGGAVATAAPVVTSGFTGSYAGRVTLEGGREVFVKAGGPSMPHVVGALAQEARVLAALPHGIPAPALVGAGSVDGWSVLVLDVVEGRMPGQPWTPADVAAVHRACLTVAELTTPVPHDLRGPSVAESMAGDAAVLRCAGGLADGSFALPGWSPGWMTQRRADLAALALAASQDDALLAGDTLTHGDLRPDNVLVAGGVDGADGADGRVARIVDWNWVGTGPAWVDLVGLLPLMRREGIDTDALEATSPLLHGADPDAVDAYLAVIACYMLEGVDRPPPPGCTPALRLHQRLMAELFLEHVAHRRGWAP